MAWKDVTGAVVASTVYVNGNLVARNATVTLPSVSFATVELKAGGTVEAPITDQIDAMEMSITLGGPDHGMRDALAFKYQDIEIRWVQDVMQNDGTMRQVGCKAFTRARIKEDPGISLEVGSASENEFTFSVIRYRLVVDGEEYRLIDQLNNIFKVGNTDYAAVLDSML